MKEADFSTDNRWLLPEGVGELLPPEALALEQLRRQVLDTYWGWGYELVFPPVIEYLDSLLIGTGADLELQTFKLTDQLTGRLMGVRADMTPQAARIDAHKLRREEPVRLCYVGTVLQARPDGPGGSRNPVQVGAELYGYGGVEGDVEIIDLMLETLYLAGAEEIHLDLGHVGIYRAMARDAGLAPELEKRLFEALQRKAAGEIRELLEHLPDRAAADRIAGLASLNGGVEVLDQAGAYLSDAGEEVLQAMRRLWALASALESRHPEVTLHFDLAELAGYQFHTGVVFAAFVPGNGKEVARGGRYDDIGRVFGRARPATGFSADLKALLDLGAAQSAAEQPPAVLAPWSDDAALQRRIRELRTHGERVVVALPGRDDSPQALGCDRLLRLQADEWVVVPAE
ncbi:MAG: ATP phosphoribosyltransferase regulatory subunit [Ectothiorhodospiraceae bacterium]|nr:ATP phosphoribosyltransferase regulatory subunit [Ectothiorhodospiraceae bacterium]MCH8503079.1 ATP phosphoribosyltransferase regulatory subunit [Ectothiorhodospiraceae bacterium]